MRTAVRSVCLCWIFLLNITHAFAVELVFDVNGSHLPGYSYGYGKSVDLPSGTLLAMQDAQHGTELWFTDGISAAGTHLVRDICPGPTSSMAGRFFVIRDFALFFANDCINGAELWRSDGTPAGTYMVANIGPGAVNYGGAYEVAIVNDTLIFSANDGYSGTEVWRSDGTAAGTYQLRDIAPGSNSSDPDRFAASPTHVFFSTQGLTPQVWVTDGTKAGTRAIASVSRAMSFTVVGNTMFFSAMDQHGQELWRASADGSDVQMVANINTEPYVQGNDQGSYPEGLFELNGSLIFSANVTDNGSQTFKLYRADPAGTGVTELATMPSGGSPTRLIRVNNSAFFGLTEMGVTYPTTIWMTDGTPEHTGHLELNGLEYSEKFNVAYGNGEAFFFGRQPNSDGLDKVWRTDGTRSGTRLLTDVATNTLNANIAYLNGRVYFEAGLNTTESGNELWSSDGTQAGTFLVRNIAPDAADLNIVDLRVARGRLLFFAQSSLEPWASDGTEAGTISLESSAETMNSTTGEPNIAFAGTAGSRAFFAAEDGTHGRELWITDGTTGGSRLVKDIIRGANSSSPSNFVSLGDVILFVADDWDHGPRLWRSDGTETGTYLVADIRPIALGSGTTSVVMNGVAYFIADSSGPLWRSDGSSAGTYQLASPEGITRIHLLGNTGTRLLVGAQATANGPRVWSTDGIAGHETVIATGLHFVPGDEAKSLQDRGCFRAWETSPQFVDIWCSNGSAGDLVRATNLASIDLSADEFWIHRDRLLVNATGAGQVGLYVSDGVETDMQLLSTHRIADAKPFEDELAFVSKDGLLMATDGTFQGTRNLLQGAALSGGQVHGSFGVLGKHVVFTVNDPQMGTVLWRTDGTTNGTRYIADVDADSAIADPEPAQFLQLGDQLLFTAFRTDIGHELFSLNTANPNASDDAASAAFGSAATIDVLANDADFNNTLNPASVTVIAAPASGTTRIDPTRGIITYVPREGFSGTDQFTYRVSNEGGTASNVATVRVAIAEAPEGGPSPPSPTPVPNNPPPQQGGGSSSGGGGGQSDLLLLGLLALYAGGQHRQQRKARD